MAYRWNGGWGGGWGGRSSASASSSSSLSSGGGGGRMTLAAVMATRVPRLATIPTEAMLAGEAAAREVVLRVHPTEAAERSRQDVIGYLKRLFGTSLGCQVFAFGSVPLKTYLPDGDVDITVLGNTAADSTFISDVRSILESEEHDDDAELELKGLHFINAEVKLVKCVIEKIVVDISFNQIGGVSTLCFLELVDREVGKNHLFKRSIMLIKSWCYHESRILGAHHGLISTYALETLVLYIFNIFHKSLHGPLEVLYKFLEYFSKFDWDKYCISLNGPVPISSLPNLTVEPSGIHAELLFGKEILEGSFSKLIVLPEVSDGSNTNFRLKYLNIIDPLKWSNNLGRSVSKGNFYRIRSAFSFGAQKLGHILMLPTELISTEIFGFFENTLKRHGRGERSDLGNNGSFESMLSPKYALGEDASCLKSSDTSEDENRSPDHSLELSNKESNVETNMHRTSCRYFRGDTLDRPWNKIWFTNSDIQYYNIVSGDSFMGHSSFSPENGNGFMGHSSFSPVNGNGGIKQFRKGFTAEEDLPLGRSQICENNRSHILTPSTRTNTLDVSNSCPVNESNRSDLHEEKLLLYPFSPSNLLDLAGDLDLHLGCLRKVQYHLESLFDGLVKLAQETYLSGVLDEDSFKIPTERFLSNTEARSSRLLAVSSADTERKNLSPVYYSHRTADISRKSHIDDRMNTVCQQNMVLPPGTHSNRLALPPSPAADSKNYPVSLFHTTKHSPTVHGTGMHTSNNAPFLFGTDVLSHMLAQMPFLEVDLESYELFLSYISNSIQWPRGTGTYIPKMSYEEYKERILSERRRRQREKSPERVFRIKTNRNPNQHNLPEVGGSSSRNGGITVESSNRVPTKQGSSQQDCSSKSANLNQHNLPEVGSSSSRNGGITVEISNRVPTKQGSSQQDCSSKSAVPAEGGSAQDRAPTQRVTKQTPTSLSGNARNKQQGYICSDMNVTDNQKPDASGGLVGPDRQSTPSSSSAVLPRPVSNGQGNIQESKTCLPSPPATEVLHPIKTKPEKGLEFGYLGLPRPVSNGQGNIQKSNTCLPSPPATEALDPIKTKQVESLEFGSLGPISLGVASTTFKEEFPPLPERKGPAEAPSPTLASPGPAATVSRPQGFYELKDEADFPALQAGPVKKRS